MRRTWSTLLSVALVAGVGGGLAVASMSRPVVQLATTKLGKILVNGRGFTVYTFTRDRKNVNSCAKIKGCPAVWPAVTVSGKPVGGRGIKSSLLGTIRFKGRLRQVTYGGHPLYTYAGDSQRGETTYVNISQYGGRWPAVNHSGREVK